MIEVLWAGTHKNLQHPRLFHVRSTVRLLQDQCERPITLAGPMYVCMYVSSRTVDATVHSYSVNSFISKSDTPPLQLPTPPTIERYYRGGTFLAKTLMTTCLRLTPCIRSCRHITPRHAHRTIQNVLAGFAEKPTLEGTDRIMFGSVSFMYVFGFEPTATKNRPTTVLVLYCTSVKTGSKTDGCFFFFWFTTLVTSHSTAASSPPKTLRTLVIGQSLIYSGSFSVEGPTLSPALVVFLSLLP